MYRPWDGRWVGEMVGREQSLLRLRETGGNRNQQRKRLGNLGREWNTARFPVPVPVPPRPLPRGSLNHIAGAHRAAPHERCFFFHPQIEYRTLPQNLFILCGYVQNSSDAPSVVPILKSPYVYCVTYPTSYTPPSFSRFGQIVRAGNFGLNVFCSTKTAVVVAFSEGLQRSYCTAGTTHTLSWALIKITCSGRGKMLGYF